MSKNRGTTAKNFETSLAQLEQIVREMEGGDLPLEKSLELFEQGVRLSRDCQERLNEAERRIEVLVRDGEGRPLVKSAAGLVAVPESADEDDTDDEEKFDEDEEAF